MRFVNKLAISLTFVTLLLAPSPLLAGEPSVQLSATINEFVNILVNTPVAELRAKGLPARAMELVFSRFDFSEMTKRSLERHWGALAPADQREFVSAFTQKLLVAYGRTVRTSGTNGFNSRMKSSMATMPR